jgi:hypothetical protein
MLVDLKSYPDSMFARKSMETEGPSNVYEGRIKECRSIEIFTPITHSLPVNEHGY